MTQEQLIFFGDVAMVAGITLTLLGLALATGHAERKHRRTMAELDARHKAEMERTRNLDALVRIQMERAIRLIGGTAR